MADRIVHPWKRTEIDRGHQRRVTSAVARGEYTPPGTKPNPTDPDKVRVRKAARREYP